MLSLETCEKLKSAGLQWEPQFGDYFYNLKGELKIYDISVQMASTLLPEGTFGKLVFAPRLASYWHGLIRRNTGGAYFMAVPWAGKKSTV